MRKSVFLLMAGLAVAALTAMPVAAASRPAPSAAMPDVPGVAPHTPWADAPLAVLYNQYNNAGGVAVNSQNFEAAYDAYDSQAADDFTVPANTQWTVKGVAAQGLYFNGPGPAQSFNVRLYQDGGGEPGTLRVTRLNMTYTLNGADEFRVRVNPSVRIPASPNPRHVWVELQANLDFAGGAGGQWGWTDRTAQSGDPAAWQNTGGGFGVCPTWDVLDVCLGGQADGDDFVYLLVGTTP